jgi:putative nucleotidyltransferase with HDIG domain
MVLKKQEQPILERIDMTKIEDFCRQIYCRDHYTAMHAEHVADLMAGLASFMGMSTNEMNLAYMVGLMHDIGKIKTPEKILHKPGRLTDEEYEIMKRHAEDGAKMLKAIGGVKPIVAIMRHHHEQYGGGGYPDKLKGEQIPFFSRMLAVCDSFDAMTTQRCYRQPVDLRTCLLEIKQCAGRQFDPQISKDFIGFIQERFGFSLEDNDSILHNG